MELIEDCLRIAKCRGRLFSYHENSGHKNTITSASGELYIYNQFNLINEKGKATFMRDFNRQKLIGKELLGNITFCCFFDASLAGNQKNSRKYYFEAYKILVPNILLNTGECRTL